MKELINRAKQEGISEEVVEKVLVRAWFKNIKAREIILDYGQNCNLFYFVTKGGFVMRCWDEEKESERTVNFFLSTYQPFMTDPKSCFLGSNSDCRIQAITNSDVIVFSKSDLEKFTETEEEFRLFFHKKILQTLLTENDFRIKLLTYRPQKLYKHMVKNYPEIIKNVSSKDVADFLGISDVWLSNLKSRI